MKKLIIDFGFLIPDPKDETKSCLIVYNTELDDFLILRNCNLESPISEETLAEKLKEGVEKNVESTGISTVGQDPHESERGVCDSNMPPSDSPSCDPKLRPV